MDSLRKKRLESTITREMAQLIFLQQTKDDRIQFVSVRNVKLANDFRQVKVYVSFFSPSQQERELSFQILKTRAKHLQSILGRNLRLRFTPRLLLLESEAKDEQSLPELKPSAKVEDCNDKEKETVLYSSIDPIEK